MVDTVSHLSIHFWWKSWRQGLRVVIFSLVWNSLILHTTQLREGGREGDISKTEHFLYKPHKKDLLK